MPNDRDEEFSRYVSAHRGRMLRVARLLTTGDAHWAEDLVQTALTKLYLKWSAVDQRTGAARYADRILVNVFLDEKRRFWRHRETLSDDVTESGRLTGPVATAQSGSAPEGRPEERLVMLDALAQLPKRQRAVVVLRFFSDLDVATVADLMGCSQGTVKSQTARGLDKLRDLVADPLDTLETAR
ncbi:RNA polymerase, sigma-24 subunit, ECF subfamily [Kribbella flavida DSM 17836]|uniref:RNA polymerase, sigma-24 subunit, ECF subfamily n=1 Tax=Kribbella flavida (strain DSM 17836 / JCM 10339 / NBRC 14399) TaxID=479435 RepID=D2PX52_KRIFD|nr:SigE family RNA polymerase sigma factor [Kribbella flavida]ADB35432.1 RNA polymerase, sigma-24 subunit, ECF subfamily [Kribbella flavida DSM 17836]